MMDPSGATGGSFCFQTKQKTPSVRNDSHGLRSFLAYQCLLGRRPGQEILYWLSCMWCINPSSHRFMHNESSCIWSGVALFGNSKDLGL
ncbi:hypothetical protein BJY01DRAFT_220999, partial [Aspergillus pseudoustus]